MTVSSIHELVFALVRIARFTHRHPVNRLFHIAAIPLYAIGVTMVFGAALRMHPGDGFVGGLLWLGAVAIMLAGHAIEGNLRTVTPVLVARLFLRFLCSKRNPRRKSVHLI